MKAGFLFRPGSFWIGVHWSPYNKRFCINVIPMVTLWVTLAGGVTPHKEREIQEQRQLIQRRIEHIRADGYTRLKFGDWYE
jgi:hypothetical protein